MNVWAIKLEGTDLFLPDTPSRGKTQVEPVNNDVPRLFTTRKGALCALTWWKKGITYMTRTSGWDGYLEDEYQSLEECPERAGMKMEVVAMQLLEIGR